MLRLPIVLLFCALATVADARILVVGDSNAVGQGIDAEAAWPMRLMRMLNEPVQVYGGPGEGLARPFPLGIGINTYATPGPTPAIPASIGDGPSGVKVIQGVSGVVPDGFSSFRFGVTGLRCAVLALGTNDIASKETVPEIRAAVAAILSVVVAPWICITPPGIANESVREHAGLKMADIRAAISAECLSRGAKVIDGADLLPANTSTTDGRTPSQRCSACRFGQDGRQHH